MQRHPHLDRVPAALLLILFFLLFLGARAADSSGAALSPGLSVQRAAGAAGGAGSPASGYVLGRGLSVQRAAAGATGGAGLLSGYALSPGLSVSRASVGTSPGGGLPASGYALSPGLSVQRAAAGATGGAGPASGYALSPGLSVSRAAAGTAPGGGGSPSGGYALSPGLSVQRLGVNAGLLTTTITAGPAEGAVICTATPQFSFTGSSTRPGAVISFLWRVDGQPWNGPIPGPTVTLPALADGPHTFQVAAEDELGDVAPTPATRHFTVATVALALTHVAAVPAQTTAAVTWQSDLPATSQVSYRVQGSTAWTNTPLDTTLVTSHAVTITGLAPGTTYEYQVQSVDTCGDTATSPIQTFTTARDTTPPNTGTPTLGNGSGQGGGSAGGQIVCGGTVIINVIATDPYYGGTTLTYKYSVDGGPFQGPVPGPTITLTNLTDGTHTVTIEAINPAGLVDPNPPTLTFTVDTAAPAISNVSAGAPGQTSATITWTTDKAASSQVQYRVKGAAAWTSTTADSTLVTSHSVALTGLAPVTTYEYQALSADACHLAASPILTFTTTGDTLPPTTSIVSPANGATVCTNAVTVTVTGADPNFATAALTYQYALDGGPVTAAPGSTFTLTGLAAGPHTVKVAAVNPAGLADPNPPTLTFTVDATPPAISGVAAAPRDVRATITWTTDRPTTSQVDYGPTGAYGTSTPVDATLVTFHSVTITGLTAQTTYHFRVDSADACHAASSDDQTVTTTAPLLPNLAPTSLTFPTPVTPHQSLTVGWVVQNSGLGDAPAPWNDALYLSPTPTLDTANPRTLLLGKFNSGDALTSGSTYTQSQSLRMPSVPAGSYYAILVVDADNAIAETTKSDNALAVPVQALKVQTLIATPSVNALTLHVGTALPGLLNLGNLGDAPLTGLTATVTGAPANVTVTVTPPDQVGPMDSQPATVTVLANNASLLAGTAVVTFSSNEGQQATATLNLTVVPPRPNLVVASNILSGGALTASMVRGQQTLVQATVTNTGDVTATGLVVSIPRLPWMTLATPAAIGDLAPGQSASVVLSLMPAVSLPLELYRGLIAVNGTNASVPINFAFTAVSSAFGSLKVTSSDEFTYFAVPPQPLAGAAVTLTDAVTGSVVLTGTTDQAGDFAQGNIREGSYNLTVTAPGHSTYHSSVQITGSRETDLAAFLSRQLVTYQWFVVPVGIQDQYSVRLQAVFQTNVPAPVVTVSPTLVDLTKLQYDQNGQAVLYFTITNHGLIAADDTRLNLPARPDYVLTTPMADLGALAALTTIVVPVTITNTSLAPRSVVLRAAGLAAVHGAAPPGGVAAPQFGALGCSFDASVNWDYFCGGPREQDSPISFTTAGCPSLDGDGGGIPPPGTVGISGDITAGIGGGGDDVAYGGGDPPALDLSFLCDPCDRARLMTIYDCYNTISEYTDCSEDVVKVAESCPEAETVVTAVPCVYYVYKSFEDCYTVIKDTVTCAESIVDACSGIGGPAIKVGAIGPRDSGTPDTPDITNLRTHIARLQAHLDFLQVFLGSPKWAQVPASGDAAEQTLINAITAAMDPGSDGGLTITPAEAATIAALPLPATITAADVSEVIGRWDRTITYYGESVFAAGQVPAGQSTDFIPAAAFDAAKQAAADAAAANIADGYQGILEGANAAVQTIEDDILTRGQQAGTCAQVKVQLDQTVAITRTAFNATLELDNAAASAPLSGIRVSLKVTDAAGNDATALFGITAPTVTGFAAVDGTGALGSGQDGTAQWTITPTHDAAATGTTQYFVTGSVSYQQSGATITLPLFPTGITVVPDPYLQMHYFLTKQVYSDDPFTPQVEPAEPFSLGLLVDNTGLGTAHNFTITSSQPEIVDNEKGLLINFSLIGTLLGTQTISPSLTVDFGDVPGLSTAVAQFILTASLSGQFISYGASFMHTDDLGNPKTSLIDSVDIHSLEHVVRVLDPADDGKPDFLADDTPDPDNLPDTLWNSDGTTAHATAMTNATGDTPVGGPITTDGPVSDANLVVHLTAPATAGFVYIRTDDPAQGNYTLIRVIRSDGKQILVGPNAWTTSRTLHLKDGADQPQHRLYLFDASSTGQYTLVYGQNAPVARAIGGLKALADGTQVTFGQPTGSTGSTGTSGGTTGGATGGGTGIATPSGQTVVTAVFPDGMYVEALDRSSGIKVVPAGAAAGDIVTGTGTLQTAAGGERYIQATAVTVTGRGQVDPLAITDKALYSGDYLYSSSTGAGQRGMAGGAGLDIIGLEVATLGKVVADDGGGVIHVDDGYGRPVKLVLPAVVAAPAVGTFIGAAGVVTCESLADGLHPVLRLRAPADLMADLSAVAGTFVAPADTLSVGQNVFSLPGLPADPAPTSVLGDLSLTALTGNLNRYDAPTQGEIFYDPAAPFNLLVGEGYRLQLSAAAALGFAGYRTDFADMWLSLPRTGATRIGHPFAFPVDWSTVHVTDGDKTVSLADAARVEFPAWLQSRATYYDSVAQVNRLLGLPDDTPAPDSTQLLPWLGYYVLSQRDDLALIVPHTTAPILQAISPATAQAGGPAFTLTVTGDDFTPDAAVDWNGSARATSYVSATQLTARVTAADIAAAGTARVTVSDAGGVSAALSFTITPTNPVPTITSLSPASAQAGGTAFTLTVTGTGFAQGAVLSWNGSARATSYVSATQLTAQVTAADIAAAGTAQVTVTNPPPGGGASAPSPFLITAATATDVTAQVQVTESGLTYNPFKQTFSGTLTVTNTGGQAIPGPIQVVLTGLPAGITLRNASGTVGGDPYLTVSTGPLAAGATVTVPVQFLKTGTAGVNYSTLVFSGGF